MMSETRRILFIDDDPALGRLVQRDFARHGYEVVTATCGADGVALAGPDFDVICLDHHMPDQDGLETLQSLRGLADLPPVVYVTGSEDGRTAIAALRAGACDYVIKEASTEFLSLLRAAIDSAIERDGLRKEKERAEREIREARDRAEELAEQRALLLREVNHRVANSLQLIAALTQLQGASVQDPAARQALAEMSSRVYAVAQVHRRLYTSDDVRTVALHEYVSGLLDEIRRSLDGKTELFRFEVETTPLAVKTDTAVSIGVIVTELVTNAVKYAYPDGKGGPIRIQLGNDGAAGRLVVEDDGIGFTPTSKAAVQGTGVGQRIIDALATSINGEVLRERHDRGMRVTMTFPLPSPT